jgi:hypothetical protein
MLCSGYNRTIGLTRRWRTAILAVAAGALLALPAGVSASVVTFAQFEENTGSSDANLFSYLDNGAAGDAEITGESIPVTFTYLSQTGLPPDLQGPQAATLTITASTIGAESSFGGGVFGQTFDQSGALNDVLTITRDTPAVEGNGSRTDLLTADFTAVLYGPLGFTIPNLVASTNGMLTLSYSSDFLNFGSDATADFNLAFSSWTTTSDGNGLEASPSDSYFATATAAAAGTFDVDSGSITIVPEPAGLAIAMLALCPMLLRRRRRSIASA